MQFILWIVLALPPLGLAETPCEGAAGTVVTEVRLKGLEATRPHVVRRYLQHPSYARLDALWVFHSPMPPRVLQAIVFEFRREALPGATRRAHLSRVLRWRRAQLEAA